METGISAGYLFKVPVGYMFPVSSLHPGYQRPPRVRDLRTIKEVGSPAWL